MILLEDASFDVLSVALQELTYRRLPRGVCVLGSRCLPFLPVALSVQIA